MFSGQGSHFYQMGKDLYGNHPVFREVMEQGDVTAKRLLHRSVIDEIYGQAISVQFTDLQISQPALMLVQYATAKVLISEGIKPDYVWGSSAGEFVAAILAGVLNINSAMEMIIEQSKLLIQHCPLGGMIAVLTAPETYQNLPELRLHATLAGINYDNHFVVSGSLKGLETVKQCLKDNQIISQILPVNYAFHSSEIDPAKKPFLDYTNRQTDFKPAEIPILSSAFATQITHLECDYFWHVVREPIQFSKTLSTFEHKNDGIFIDCGPSGTLATFLKYSFAKGPPSRFFPILTPYANGRKNIDSVKAHLGATYGEFRE